MAGTVMRGWERKGVAPPAMWIHGLSPRNFLFGFFRCKILHSGALLGRKLTLPVSCVVARKSNFFYGFAWFTMVILLTSRWGSDPRNPPATRLYLAAVYMVFRKKDPFLFSFHDSLKWLSIYTKFLAVVAEEILIQNILTKYGSWLNILC